MQATTRWTLKERLRRPAILVSCLLWAIGTASVAGTSKFAAVDDTRLRNAASEPGEWFTGGRDGEGTYYSPLEQINSDNVTTLGFAWEYRLGSYRGLEATPIVVDGVMYTSGQRGMVYALDARTGQKMWTFDPEINPQYMRYACCDAVNRGIAIKNGLVYVGALDGRLFALDAATGKTKWSANTVVDQKAPHTSTGAPQLTKDLVIIGNSGAESVTGGVRGHVSAYDLKSGAFRWRFYTVPVPGEKDPAPEIVAAAKTWDSKRHPFILGGGTVWDGMSYDPDLNLVYIATGNPTPYDRARRGGGDNLYTDSIVAIDAATGRMAWYYQFTPGDIWDYDAVQKMILAELTIKGRSRKVIMQANKNGYFYVIDRKTGVVISAKPFVHVNWSTGMDAKFRPIINPEADYADEIKLIYPSAAGGHSWQPMSYNPKTGLVYIPAFDAPDLIGGPKKPVKPPTKITDDDAFDGYYVVPGRHFDAKAAETDNGKLPKFNLVDAKTGQSITRYVLKAWNPVTQKEVWAQPVSEDYESMEGGAMSTAGNLVFQGTSLGELRIYAADSGKLLHTLSTGTAMMAAPCTYMIDGVQYVAIMAGFGGDHMAYPLPLQAAAARYDNEGRILVFRLGGSQNVPRTAERVVRPLAMPPPQHGSVADIADGRALFNRRCSGCHSGGILPDLPRMEDGIGDLDIFQAIVLDGARAGRGMPRFDDLLAPQDVQHIHAYLIEQAHKRYAKENAEKP